jgi:spore germination protein GerM
MINNFLPLYSDVVYKLILFFLSKTIHSNQMLKNIASNEFITIVELKKAFENLLDTPFFSGPLTEQEAETEFLNKHQLSHPMLIFYCEDQFFIVYP